MVAAMGRSETIACNHSIIVACITLASSKLAVHATSPIGAMQPSMHWMRKRPSNRPSVAARFGVENMNRRCGPIRNTSKKDRTIRPYQGSLQSAGHRCCMEGCMAIRRRPGFRFGPMGCNFGTWIFWPKLQKTHPAKKTKTPGSLRKKTAFLAPGSREPETPDSEPVAKFAQTLGRHHMLPVSAVCDQKTPKGLLWSRTDSEPAARAERLTGARPEKE